MVGLAEILAAQSRLLGQVHLTPILTSRSLNRLLGSDLRFKAEHLQRTGAFKIRGAVNFLALRADAELPLGVVTASAGNHAQGVALAAAEQGVPATVVMPATAAVAKAVATRSYGATVLLEGETFDDAVEVARRLATERGLSYVPAFDDAGIVAGQGTIGLEILDQVPDLDTVIVPIGGGGLASGIAIAVKELRPSVRVIGVQAAGADGCFRSLAAGEITPSPEVSTIADGIAVKRPGVVTFPILQRYLDDLVTVDDELISQAIVLYLERTKQMVEGAGAAALAALLGRRIARPAGPIAIVVSGGNLDPNLLGRVVQHGMAAAGRYLVLRTTLADRPGALRDLLKYLADEGANVIDIEHHRVGVDLPLDTVAVLLTVETRDAAHGQTIRQHLAERGFGVVVTRSSLEDGV